MGLEDLKKLVHDLQEKSVTKEKAIEAMKVALTKSKAATRKTAYALGADP